MSPGPVGFQFSFFRVMALNADRSCATYYISPTAYEFLSHHISHDGEAVS
jgi:hypothetical protein